MLFHNPPQKDCSAATSKFTLSLHSRTPSDLDIDKKRHTIHSYNNENAYPSAISNASSAKQSRPVIGESGLDEKPFTPPTHYWETLENFYVKKLNSLEKEIETSVQQNEKLSTAKEELVQEILKLHHRFIELNTKNETLARSIAEKENHISAFMYNKKDNISNKRPDTVGVTLVDQPCTPSLANNSHNSESGSINSDNNVVSTATSPSSSTSIPTTSSQTSNNNISNTKQPGIFRQISLRLSRKRRQQDDAQPQQQTLNISDPINTTAPKQQHPLHDEIVLESPPLLHPAMVISSPSSSTEQKKSLSRGTKVNGVVSKRNKNIVFGNDLTRQARLENATTPSLIIKCIQEVESRGMTVEGIYRKSGTFALIKELQDSFDEKKDPKLSKYQDIHIIASLLKLYLRELPVPLVSTEFVLPPTMTAQERLNKTYALLHKMPLEVYCTIKFLMQHLKRVHQNHKSNCMNSKNLAVVFGPTLMRFSEGNEEQQMHDMINTINFIIHQSHILFADYS